MAISTNGTVIARLAGGLYNTVMSNATYLEVASQDPSTLANTLYARDFAKSTDLAVATTLLANLGLASQAGLDAWVAAQLTAAGAANKGAKIVSLLNDFAGLASDATWGTYATAFNAKVDAALAASQKTGAVEAKFADAGVVAVANATFTLTTGADVFTGGAGKDSFIATGTTLTAGDVLTGQAGDSLTITDLAASFGAGLPASVTITGIPTVTVTTTGKLGTLSSAATSAKQTFQFTASAANSDLITYSHTPAGTTTAVATTSGATDNLDTTGENAAAKAATAIAAQFAKLGYAVTTTANTATAAVVPTLANTVNVWTAAKAGTTEETTTVTVTGAPGVVLPVLSVNTSVGTGTAVPVIATTAASDAVSAASFAASAMTGLTSLTAASAGGANIAAAKTMDVTLTNTSGVAQVSSANAASVTGTTNGVYVSAASGPVTVVTTTPAGVFGVAKTSSTGTATLTGLANDWGTYSWSGTTGTLTAGKAGVLVTGGTTVSVTEAGGTITTTASTSANATDVQIGSAVNVSAAGSLTGTETIRNLAVNPTGDVTVSRVTPYADADGLKNVRFGTGATDINTNGATTVSVTGSGAVTIVDVGTTKLVPSSNVASVAGVSKLATVNLGGLSGNASITSDAITTVSVKDTLGTTAKKVTISNSTTSGANSGAFNLQVSNSGTSDAARFELDHSTATSLNISSASESVYQKVGGAGANGAQVATSNSGSKSFVTLTTPKATSLTMTNSLAIDIGTFGGTTAGVIKVGVINAAGATGAVTATIGAANEAGMIFTGGSGKDSVTLTGDVSVTSTTKATTVSLGAGDDSLLNSSATTTFTGATFDGGAGNDTVAASLITVGNASKFTNFEILGLDSGNGAITDITLLGGITGLSLLSNAVNTSRTYTSVTQDKSLAINATTGGGSTVLSFASVTGSSDSYAVTFGATGSTIATSPTAITAGVLSIEGIENVTLNSGGTGFVNNQIDLKSATAKALTIAGNQNLQVNFDTAFGANSATTALANGVSLIDASTLTGKLTLTAANVKSAFAGITIKGGSNDDSITLTTKTGDTGSSGYTVEGGAGNDTIITANEKATLTGGAGSDYFDVTATKSGVNNAAGLDTALVFTTITDFAAGDTIKMGTTTVANTGKLAVVSANSLTTALDAALKSASALQNTAVWFVYGGSTYIAVEGDATDGLSGSDMIVKLTGVTSDLVWTSVGSATGLVGIA